MLHIESLDEGLEIFKALGSEVRIEIIKLLLANKSMNMNELATVHKYNLPIIIVVMNNGALGMVRQWQTIFNEKRYAETDITDDVDLVKLAEAFYMKGIRVDNIKDLEAAVSEGISENKYLLIEAMIDKDSLVLPMIPVGGGYEDAILGR